MNGQSSQFFISISSPQTQQSVEPISLLTTFIELWYVEFFSLEKNSFRVKNIFLFFRIVS